MISLIVVPRNWWRGHRWGVRIEPPGDEGIKLVTEAICYVRIFNDLGIGSNVDGRHRECLRNGLVPTPRTYVSVKAISLPRRPRFSSQTSLC
ncbi:proteasome subunit beta type-7-B-like [Pyrus x bretschneideri]|uniref:proteasome subunit beta type-7-B-like n=1 Tax=Pyrus x bretschneideri TaxID=225117 RepID=UPI002030132B|nr:proteasome subunit beta type-7-B-like [Pyrus x bretschneideri]